MKVSIATRLPCHPQLVWNHLRTTRLVRYVSYPFMIFEPINPPELPEQWAEGRYRVAVWFCDLVPAGEHTLVLSNPTCNEIPGKFEYQIRDNGFGDSAKRWDHTITLSEHGDETLLTDEIIIEAGLMTLPMTLYAKAFYGYRQARWRQLVNNGFDFSKGSLPLLSDISPRLSRVLPACSDRQLGRLIGALTDSGLYRRAFGERA